MSVTVKGANLATTAVRTYIAGKLDGTLSDGPDDDTLVAALLVGPTGGRFHPMPLPQEMALPAISYSRYGAGTDVSPLGRDIPTVATTIRMQVKALCEGYDEEPIEQAADAINQLLDGRSATFDVSGYGTFYVESRRESELLTDLPPDDDGTVYQQLGGIYAFYVVRVG